MTDPIAKTPTASTFREPLLRSLGMATGLQANHPVRMDDILPLVYKGSGIAEDAHGKDVNNWFKVRLWVQQCYKLLRRKNLAIKAGRGSWGLSDEGVKVAATLLGLPVPAQTTATPTPVVAPTTPVAAEDINLDDLLDEFTPLDTPADLVTVLDPGPNDAEDGSATLDAPEAGSTLAPTAAATHEGGEGVAYALGAQINSYNPDPYIRGIAIESTGCFGEFSTRSPVCKTCPLSGACKATVLTQLSRIAAKLRLRDAEAIRRANMPVAPPAPTPPAEEDIDDIIAAIEDEVNAPKAPKAPEADVTKMKVPADGKCRGCSNKVERGTEAMYERGVGIYHIECYAKK